MTVLPTRQGQIAIVKMESVDRGQEFGVVFTYSDGREEFVAPSSRARNLVIAAIRGDRYTPDEWSELV